MPSSMRGRLRAIFGNGGSSSSAPEIEQLDPLSDSTSSNTEDQPAGLLLPPSGYSPSSVEYLTDTALPRRSSLLAVERLSPWEQKWRDDRLSGWRWLKDSDIRFATIDEPLKTSVTLQAMDKLCQDCSKVCLVMVHFDKSLAEIRESWPLDRDKLLAAAGEGCQLCSMVWRNSIDPFFTTGKNSVDLKVEENYQKLNTSSIPDAYHDGAIRIALRIILAKGEIIISVEKDTRAAKILTKEPHLTNLGGEAAFLRVEKWFEDCSKYHTQCLSDNVFKCLPKRVLNVGSSQREPFLYQPDKGDSGLYAALSYCWGTKPQPVLTQKLLNTGATTFTLSSLPLTIQDAIAICRRLSIEFLWVDALCIIQDSADGRDWISQSAIMDDIYGNAHFTIVAASATNVWEGMFSSKKAKVLEQDSCTVPFNIYVEDSRMIIPIPGATATLNNFYPHDIDSRQPLATRAWAFQEFAISHRILSYHDDQVVWKCKTEKCYLEGPLDVQKRDEYQDWRRCVVQFTSRTLKFADDRLMALSGLARSKQKNFKAAGTGNEYLAGLWSKDLVEHLLWISKVTPPLARPASYRAPTWSWGSIDGAVEFVAEERTGQIGETISGFKFMGASLATNPLNSFGTLLSFPLSYMRVKGFLKPIIGLDIPSTERQMPTQGAFRKKNTSWWIEFDCIDVEQRMDRAVAEANEPDKQYFQSRLIYSLRLTEFTALLLVPVSRKGGLIAFERIGVVLFWFREICTWFDDITKRTKFYLV